MTALPSFPDTFNLADYYLFDRLREGLGEKGAIRYGERAYTYAEVAERTRSLAGYFSAVGVRREERVYIVLPDTPPFAWAFFATLAHGAVVAMGNPDAPADDLAHVVAYSRCSVLVTVPRVAEALAPALRESALVRAVILVPETETGGDCDAHADAAAARRGAAFDVVPMSKALARGAEHRAPAAPATHRDDVAVWLFTSGSTGRAKAAFHTHRDFAFNTECYAKRTVGYRRDDVTVSVPRLYFGYATGTNLMFPFAVGATTCLYSERPTAETLAGAVARYRPTVVTNVPTMMAKLLDHDDAQAAVGAARLDFSSVRFHLSAGEALPPALLERFVSRFGADVYDGIGSAEMFHIYAANRPGDVRPGSLGRAVEGYEIRILPADASVPGQAEVPRGETGVMWVRGDSVALGYFQDRDKSWETFHGRWCRTGDLFAMDAEGYLWFSGRADSLFKSGGIWVAPLEIEECLMDHEAVAMAAVIPAEEAGLTKPKAFVVTREGRSVADTAARAALGAELQAHVKARLSKHKYPRWVVFVDDLPRNDRGKVDRKRLIEREHRGENPAA
ncbi:MAG: benzoate-CoA ligase family protein [Candidatus Krumholzibacteria bacterium]|nr:benzoate-CoA ligase family protein [Candidatus Krumholzibacteria bacterium]